ncbi:hypothetical protein TBLA_0A09140 [Henningerozyma blattae CBS 6284]|uniref:Uncharacterized protein n=1 Tax=Henningerozyma blattae (strain ATCC 34711 / CBS 6284 / DSM 70876 / NBRC 10599 / NRRL Y-10934 / UCD 77-7) TaxID=1071380 RepID=I2GX50_HENB6|nr:hypothetical protein TBLA_0A09140 [Tetrapisispora blattae CBS 6284]CCH58702.1 hypothetical protein TBLA_0A09140 [Tetrapisispora blattae CBS 6284]
MNDVMIKPTSTPSNPVTMDGQLSMNDKLSDKEDSFDKLSSTTTKSSTDLDISPDIKVLSTHADSHLNTTSTPTSIPLSPTSKPTHFKLNSPTTPKGRRNSDFLFSPGSNILLKSPRSNDADMPSNQQHHQHQHQYQQHLHPQQQPIDGISKSLKTRLNYAMLKVQNGWADKTLPELTEIDELLKTQQQSINVAGSTSNHTSKLSPPNSQSNVSTSPSSKINTSSLSPLSQKSNVWTSPSSKANNSSTSPSNTLIFKSSFQFNNTQSSPKQKRKPYQDHIRSSSIQSLTNNIDHNFRKISSTIPSNQPALIKPQYLVTEYTDNEIEESSAHEAFIKAMSNSPMNNNSFTRSRNNSISAGYNMNGLMEQHIPMTPLTRSRKNSFQPLNDPANEFEAIETLMSLASPKRSNSIVSTSRTPKRYINNLNNTSVFLPPLTSPQVLNTKLRTPKSSLISPHKTNFPGGISKKQRSLSMSNPTPCHSAGSAGTPTFKLVSDSSKFNKSRRFSAAPAINNALNKIPTIQNKNINTNANTNANDNVNTNDDDDEATDEDISLN